MITKYKVKVGFHSDGTTVYRKGQVFESEKPLHKMFHNKFDIVGQKEGKLKSTKTKGENGKHKPRYNTVKPLVELGKEVTQKFPDAINQGLHVYQNEEGEYSITKEDDPFTPINKKSLTRIAAKKFLLNR